MTQGRYSQRQDETDLRCRACNAPLKLLRTWSAVLLCCRACGAEYNLERYVREMDETWEEAVGNIPCDRL